MGKKIIRIYMWLTSIDHFLIGLHTTVYVMYLLNSGLDLLQVNLVNVAFMVSVFIFEIPTGAIADIFGRKISFVLSSVVMGIGFICYGLADDFVGFILAEIILAIGITLTSGAFRAWLVDSLHWYEWSGKLLDVFRLEGRCRNIAMLVGGLIGAYIGSVNLSWPLIIAGIGFFILALISGIVVREDYFTPKKFSEVRLFWDVKDIAITSIKYGLKNKVVFMVMTAIFVFYLGFPSFNMYWQPQFSQYLPSVEYLGYIWVGIILTVMIGNEMVGWFIKKFTKLKFGFIALGVVAGLFMIVAALAGNLVILMAGFFGHEVVRGILRPYVDTAIQENIPSKTRATIDSFVSMVTKGATGIGLLVFGWIAKDYSINASWLIAGLVIILLMPLVMFFNGKKSA
jgi:MFS family permease